MNKPFGNADPALADYVSRVYAAEDDALRDIVARQQAAGMPEIQIAALDGLHLTTLARAVGARRAVEIGTLGGYSGVCLLRGMPDDGVLDTFEYEASHAEVARESFRRAGLASRARVHVGPAAEKLPSIEKDGPFDLVFIDADKQGYPGYLRWAAKNLRKGGIVLGDNAFLFGELVGGPPPPERAAVIAAMHEFHHMLATSGAFVATVLPTGEGLALGVRT